MQTTDIGCEGNLFLDKLVGSQVIQCCSSASIEIWPYKQMMEKTSEKL